MGRFAPSPTGPLHQGSLVAALASFMAAKSRDGTWLVRVEDIDPPREIAGMAALQLESLAGFGLLSERPVLYQSQRAAYYEAALERLLDEGKAFHCHCSRSQLAADGGIHRQCAGARRAGPASIRLRVPDTCIAFTDGVFGRQSQNLARDVGDVVLKRADGLYAYQLAVVVDDAAQGIDQVVRGADLLDSTPRQIFLQRQLGYPTPEYAHIPLVRDANGAKLGKSQWAAALDDKARFRALHAAWQHLGQDVQVLQTQLPLPENLQIALKHFDWQALRALSARARP